MNLNEYKDYFVFLEQRDGKLMDVGLELVNETSKLAKEVGYQVVGVLLGDNIKGEAQKAINYGCDKVIVVDAPELEEYMTEPYTKALSAIAKEYKPDGLLIGATTIGRDLGPRVAGRIETGLTADATQIEIDPENKESKLLWITRPAFGGNLYGTIVCPNHRPQMATIRPGVFAMGTEEKRDGEIIDYKVDFEPKDINVCIKEKIVKEANEIDITKADFIVSGGRGIGSQEGFDRLAKFAENIGGTLAGSRGAVDAGWIDKSKQVGQTGKTVRPLVYIACGISGAVQHTAGMDQADYIIAINKDETAPIFNVADIGIVNDVFNVIDELEKIIIAKNQQ